jgi:UDP-2,3-diacylglucosamine pyrophosphatase LpxH
MNRRKTRFNYVILSDLHLAEGKKKATGQISRFEGFLFDRPFERLLLHLQERAEQREHLWTLVFNGDLIDFLRIPSIPDPNHPPKGFPPITPTKQKYGLGSSAAESKWQLERVVEGHPVFFRALARFLLQGHRAVILKGNHDVNWFWPEVRYRFMERMEVFLREVDSPDRKTEEREEREERIADALDRLLFRSWSIYVKKLLYIEHGNQYDPTNAFHNFMYPVLIDPESPVGRFELDLPFGSFFIRYFFNIIQLRFPTAPHYRNVSAFFYTIRRRHLYAFWHVVRNYFPYFFRTLQKVQTRRGRRHREIREKNLQLIRKVGEEYGDKKTIEKIAKLQEAPAYENKVDFLTTMLKRPAKKFAAAVGGLILLSFFWNILTEWILGAGQNLVMKTTLSVIFDYGFIVVGLVWLFLILRPTKEGVSYREVEPRELRKKAARIAEMLDVRYVTFGHSHVEDAWKVPGRDSWYFNTGTWTPFIDEDKHVIRPEVHFPVFLVEDGLARLARWNNEVGELEELPILEDEPPD